jgi:hypothetical protein
MLSMFKKSTIALMSISVLSLVLVLSGQLRAQSITGTISGTVVDPTGPWFPLRSCLDQ